MTDLRENLNWIIGSILGGIAATLGWFFSSGLFSTLIGVVIGAGITYFVQTRTQKRMWKREYSIKIAEQIYGQLYGSIKSIIRTLERKHYSNVSFGFWDSTQEDHRYFMVDEKFRNRLDAFLERTKKYSHAISKLDNTILPKILRDAGKEVFRKEPHADSLSFAVTYEEGKENFQSSPNLVNHLKRKQDLSDVVNYAIGVGAEKTEISNVGMRIHFMEADRSSLFESKDSEKMAKFWGVCLQMIGDNPEYQFVIKENDMLLEEAKEIKKELIKRIEEPWRI